MSEQTGLSLRGHLLVAAPTLVDPNFMRTVVLLLDHDEDGALGVVLNRPSEVDVAGTVPGWEQLTPHPEVVFVGGPVEPQAVVGLGIAGPTVDEAAWEPVLDRLGLVDLSVDPVLTGVESLRIFAGYAGWSPGQLENEIAEGSWFVVDAHPADVLAADPDELWRGVLVRQGGVFRTFPLDPSLN